VWPRVSQCLLVIEALSSHSFRHTTFGRTLSGRVISPTQRPLPYITQHLQETDTHSNGGIRTHNTRNGAVSDPHLRPHGHWDRPFAFFPFPKSMSASTARCVPVVASSAARVAHDTMTNTVNSMMTFLPLSLITNSSRIIF